MKLKVIALSIIMLFSNFSALAMNAIPIIPKNNINKLIYKQDFNDSVIETTANSISPYWSFVGIATHSISRSFETVSTGNTAYRIHNQSSSTAAQTILNLPNLAAGKKYVLEYDFKTEQTNTRKLLAYTHNQSVKQYIAELKSDGTFSVGANTATGISYQENHWYRLYVTYDLTGSLANNVKIVIKDLEKDTIVLDTTASYTQNQMTAVNIFVYNDTTENNSALWIDNLNFYEYETFQYIESFNDRVVEQSSAKNPYWKFVGSSADKIYRSYVSKDMGNIDYAYCINNQSDTGTAASTTIMTNGMSNQSYMLQYDFQTSDTVSRKLLPYTINASNKHYIFELTENGMFATQNGVLTNVAYVANTWYRANILYDLAMCGNNVTIRITELSTGNMVLDTGASYPETTIAGIEFCVYPSEAAQYNTSLYIDNVSIMEYKGFDGKFYNPSEEFYTPFTNLQVLDSVYAVKNGQDMLYASTCGAPAIFSAYNLDTQELEFSGELENATAPWTHIVDGNGDVYIASEGYLYKYYSNTKVLVKLGSVPASRACYGLSLDDSGNLYIGTYPNGTIVKYSPSTNTFANLGSPLIGQTYVRSLAYANGKLYAGTFYGSQARLAMVDVANPSLVSEISLPQRPVDDAITWINTIKKVGNKLFMFVNTKQGNCPLLVYNIETMQFVNYTYNYAGEDSYSGLYPSPELNGKVYLCGKRRITAYNLNTDTISSTSMIRPETLYGFRGAGLITMSTDTVNYPDQSVICMNYSTGKPVVFNPVTNQIKQMDEVNLKAGANVINHITKAGGDKLLTSCFMGGEASVVNMKDASLSYNFAAGQAESMAVYNDIAYLGMYPNANIYSFNLASASGYTSVFSIGDEQDRPMAVIAEDGYVMVGTSPKYGALGGSLTIYDSTTQQLECYRNIVQDESVMSLAYQNGYIYGSTSIYGGLGVSPTQTSAKVFVWNKNTQSLVTSFIPNIPGYTESIPVIGNIKIGPDGLLWAVVRGAIFAMDMNTMQIVKSLVFPTPANGYSSALTVLYNLDWDTEGTLYTNAGGNSIRAINTNAMSYKTLLSETGDYAIGNLTVGTDNYLYYTIKPNNSLIRRIKVLHDDSITGIQAWSVLYKDFPLAHNKTTIVGSGTYIVGYQMANNTGLQKSVQAFSCLYDGGRLMEINFETIVLPAKTETNLFWKTIQVPYEGKDYSFKMIFIGGLDTLAPIGKV